MAKNPTVNEETTQEASALAPLTGKPAYKCIHPQGLDHNGQTYKTAQRYVFTDEELYEGGWLDSQIKAKLFEPVE